AAPGPPCRRFVPDHRAPAAARPRAGPRSEAPLRDPRAQLHQDRARGARARPDRARAGRGRAGPDALRPEAPREPAVEAPPGSIRADPRSRPPDRDRSAAAASPGGAGGPSAPPAGFRPPRVAPDIRGTTMRTTGTGPGAER